MPRTISKTVRTFKEMIEAQETGEITSAALEKARAWMQEVATSHDWYEYVYECWISALNQIGFTDPEIQFRGFSNQGDGASFTSGLDTQLLLEFLGTAREPVNQIKPTEDGKEDFRAWLLHKTGYTRHDGDDRLLWLATSDDMINDHIVLEGCQRTDHQYQHEFTCRVVGNFDDGDKGEWISGSPGYWKTNRPEVGAVVTGFIEDLESLRRAICVALFRDLMDEYYALIEDEHLIELAEANDFTFDEAGNQEG